MLKKIVVFDGGFGGELFADYIEKELAIVDVVRVIDWRNSTELYKNPHVSKKKIIESLRPYIGKAEIIVIANHYLSIAGLDYLKNKFPNQKFIGFSLDPKVSTKAQYERAFIFAQKSIRLLPQYQLFKYRLKAKTNEFACDEWAKLIDDGELKFEKVKEDLKEFKDFKPQILYLYCAHLNDIRPMLRKIFGQTVKFEDGFKKAHKELCTALGLRGGNGKKK